MEYWKMDGAGNDFVCINNLTEKIDTDKFPAIARLLCDRENSVGADGLMAVVPADSPENDFRMLFYNSDGTMGEMCGNGARCICRFGYEHKLSGKKQRIEATAGVLTGKRLSENSYSVRLQNPENLRLNERITVDGTEMICSYVELGNPGIPHVAVEISGLADMDRARMFELGRELRYHDAYKKGANVNFYEVTDTDTVRLLTYERGVEDFTKACGTGSASTVYILTLQGRVSGRNVKVNSAGGQLIIDIDMKNGKFENLFLTGPADIVKKGTVSID